MYVSKKPIHDLVAADLMSRDLIVIPQETPLWGAARLLSESAVSGAPVVDSRRRCVGVLSTTDLVRWVEKYGGVIPATDSTLARACQFQERRYRTSDGREIVLCALPPGVCPLQVAQHKSPDGKLLILCNQRHAATTDAPDDKAGEIPIARARDCMTTDVVTAGLDTPARVLARMMLDAHIHRVIVVDGERRPVGVVSSTDILAAVAYDAPD